MGCSIVLANVMPSNWQVDLLLEVHPGGRISALHATRRMIWKPWLRGSAQVEMDSTTWLGYLAGNETWFLNQADADETSVPLWRVAAAPSAGSGLPKTEGA